MGNGAAKLTVCFTGEKLDFPGRRLPPVADENLGHSFCYLRPDPTRAVHSSRVHSEDPSSSAFRLSGASISANTSTVLTAGDHYACAGDRSSAFFESSTSFASIPLQPVPRGSISGSGPLIPGSGPLERGFLSGPIERGFLSGPLDRGGIYSGPLDKSISEGNSDPNFLRRSFSHGFKIPGSCQKTQGIIRVLRRAISKTIPRHWQSNSVVAPVKNGVKDPPEWGTLTPPENLLTVSSSEGSFGFGLEEDNYCLEKSQNLQWAQGRAGEDRVHVVVSEEFGWIFVGIYDGFNGPDAPDFLLTNLYAWVHKELKGLLWDDKNSVSPVSGLEIGSGDGEKSESVRNGEEKKENCPCPSGENSGLDSGGRRKKSRKGKSRSGVGKKAGENQRKWKCEWVRDRIELDKKLKEQWNRLGSGSKEGRERDHKEVLDALSRALRRTEEAYLDVADRMVAENPELALMGSCVLVMLMKGEDVYVMNVGDSRAVLAQKPEPDYGVGHIGQDLERINEETYDLEDFDGDGLDSIPRLNALQLTVDHSTNVEEEVRRIKREHPDDACAVMNDRVKGSLKVTRAFGAGFLKQPKWNNALLEMFRIDYIGNSPYISCSPFLHHHRLGLNDRFLILSSDGLYQYLTNEEAVNEVELFIMLQPEGDPAQHLVEEVLFRAAKKAGMDFHELLEIPQGDRRRYHDDISIIVISLEGRIWRSCV